MQAWEMDATELARVLGVDPQRGLKEEEARERLKRYGRNIIEKKGGRPPLLIFLSQFKDPLVGLLLVAALLSAFLGEWLDAALIAVILVLNAALGFYQEYKAEKALEALRSFLKPTTKVIRDGELKVIPAEELVPGDVVLLEEGDRVPADLRLVEAHDLLVDESLLTGESVPVEKSAEWKGSAPVAERKNVLYMGTSVVRGRGKGIVYATGMNTEMGKIAADVEAIEEGETSFDREIKQLSSLIGKISVGVAVLVVLIYSLRGLDLLDALTVGVALAVAAVPEGLPVVITLALSLGVLQMAKKKALVRRLKSVEVLGSVDVICTDKTGTITENRMKVVEVWGDEEWIRIVASCCNNADLRSRSGDPLEIALKEYAGEIPCQRLGEIPFSSERKMMTVIVKLNGKEYILSKGAPEVIARLVGDESFLRKAEEMAERGLRVLALAYKENDGRPEEPPYKLAGLVGLLDPPRKGVKEAIEIAKQAGIRTVMITGDHRKTAEAIARMVGIEGRVITGEELEELGEDGLEEIIEEVGVFARVEPRQKLIIVRALQKRGHVVAMTGDGVNDAPALKAADVGIALGSGTDVAKEVADLILLDDNYATIVEAVKEGRRIFDNIKKFVLYLLSANSGEVMAVFAASLLNTMLLKPVHLLLLNLFTDGAPAVALAVDPPAKDIMKRKPRRRDEPVLSRRDILVGIGLVGLLLAVGMLISHFAGLPRGIEVAWGATLLGFTVLEFVRLQTVRKEPLTTNRYLLLSLLISLGLVLLILYTPLASIFDVAAPGLFELAVIAGVALLLYAVSRFL
ncbi:MAG: cation-translocating P-type ATPase [Candidatus Diapherotrites archaeon]|nr:cation-translocating P-type ATPase [Candidatus Diapherotrites archaeon]